MRLVCYTHGTSRGDLFSLGAREAQIGHWAKVVILCFARASTMSTALFGSNVLLRPAPLVQCAAQSEKVRHHQNY